MTRTLQLATAYDNEFAFPHIQQYGILTQNTEYPSSSKKPTSEKIGLVTSLSSTVASPQDIMQFFRDEWTIEDKLHYVRDETFREDRSRIRTGNAPYAMVALRDLAIGIMRLGGLKNIAQGQRMFNARPQLLLKAHGYKMPHALAA